MKLIKIASGVSASAALLGMGGFAASAPQAQVQAAVKYQIRVSKKAYVYTSKGKKTKKSYKKNAKVIAYGTKWIKGKKYYNLGRGRYIRTSNARKVVPRYRYSTQTKKITRTIKMYQPKGVKKVIQNAYIKRSVRINNKTKKKTYGAWSTSSWKKYKVAKVSGYTASRSSVGAAKVTYKRKNQTIKITYKVIKKTNKKKKTSKKTDTKHATKPSTTPAKPANSGSSGSNGNSGSSSSSRSSSSSTSKPSTGNYSSSTKKTFTVKANNEVTTSRGKEYKYTMYSKSGSTFTSKGDTTALDGEQAFTVSDQATDSNGNTYYYVTDTDGNEYWVLSTDTDKPDNSHKAKNTLSITSANFNVKGKSRNNVDLYKLNSDQTLCWAANKSLYEYHGFNLKQYYPWIYKVTSVGTDRKGTVFYGYKDENNIDYWVNADDVERTTDMVNTPRSFEWTDSQKRAFEKSDLNILNTFRSEVGSPALQIKSSESQAADKIAADILQKVVAAGDLDASMHTKYADSENLFCMKISIGTSPYTTDEIFDDAVYRIQSGWSAEKELYKKDNWANYGHYANLIDPMHTSVAIGSATCTVNGTLYLVVAEEYWN